MGELTQEECLRLLAEHHVGRIAVVEGLQALVVPVNYAMAGDRIVFQTAEGTKLRVLQERPVAFEIDHIDLDARSGWSVYVVGVAHEVRAEFAADLLRHLGGPMPEPWVGGHRNHWVELVPRRISGRTILRLPSAVT